MKCELFEELIPLYAGGDLDSVETEDVRRHLITCASCRHLNEGFQASHDWLTTYAVPEFDEASLARMRTSVLGEIERLEKRGSWISWLNGLLPKWNPPLVLASAAIALAIASALVAAVYRQQIAPTKSGGDVIANKNAAASKEPGDIHDSVAKNGGILATNLNSNRINVAANNPRGFARIRHTAPDELLPPEAFTNGGSSNPLEPPVIPPDEPTNTEPVGATVPAELKEQEPKEMLRIELQTADPNIRIIWLTPKVESSPTNKTK